MKLYTADAIKEQVHKLLCQDCGETDYCPNCDYRELIDQILDVPTVDTEPVRYGRWQVNETNGYKDMTCLSCGWLFEYYDGLEEEWNYCPHCGALQSFAIATERREDATND